MALLQLLAKPFIYWQPAGMNSHVIPCHAPCSPMLSHPQISWGLLLVQVTNWLTAHHLLGWVLKSDKVIKLENEPVPAVVVGTWVCRSPVAWQMKKNGQIFMCALMLVMDFRIVGPIRPRKMVVNGLVCGVILFFGKLPIHCSHILADFSLQSRQSQTTCVTSFAPFQIQALLLDLQRGILYPLRSCRRASIMICLAWWEVWVRSGISAMPRAWNPPSLRPVWSHAIQLASLHQGVSLNRNNYYNNIKTSTSTTTNTATNTSPRTNTKQQLLILLGCIKLQ